MSTPEAGPVRGKADLRDYRILSVLLAVGAVLLLSSLFVGWYEVRQVNGFGCTRVTEAFAPLGVAVTTAGSGCPPSEVGSFQTAGLPETGLLYAILAGLTVVAAGHALGVIVLTRRRVQSRVSARAVLVLAIFALVAGALAPTLLVLGQPATLCQDNGFIGTPFGTPLGQGSTPSAEIYLNQSPEPSPPACSGWRFWTGDGTSWTWPGVSGPWNSFAGSNASDSAVLIWGPSVGWVLDLGGVALLSAGPALAWRMRAGRDVRPASLS